jgi:spore maturation protein CgeB
MLREFRIAMVTHSLRSDWNNGNAHFLRGLARAMGAMGHAVTCLEPENEWSVANLREEGEIGRSSIHEFARTYADLDVGTYGSELEMEAALRDIEVAIVHEWHTPAMIETVLAMRDRFGFKALFHDTHHRASSSPEQMRLLQIERFDGVLAFGEALRTIYRDRFGIERVWTLHEAADTTVFSPRESEKKNDVVWVGNWGDGERSEEIGTYLLEPAERLAEKRFVIYGVRYPQDGLDALRAAGVAYGGYLPNLCAPEVYAASRLTVHVPRQQYNGAMTGIPTIRVFEAMASGIPLISAPWRDVEGLFREEDFTMVESGEAMTAAMRRLLADPVEARQQAERGLETVLARHTCGHRAAELTSILEEVAG